MNSDNEHNNPLMKRIKQELIATKDKLQILFEILSKAYIGIDIVNTNYEVLYQNQYLTEMFGDLTGKLCFQEYMGLSEPCDFCPMIKAVETNEISKCELKGVDGRDYTIISAPFLDPDGAIDKAIEVVIDITEKKKAEEKIKESEGRYKHMLESVPIGIVISDQQGNIHDSNTAMWKILGDESRESFLLNKAQDFYFSSDYRDAFVEQLEKKGEVRNFESQMKRRNGSMFWGLLSSVAEPTSTREKMYITTLQNIDEHKKAEESIIEERDNAQMYLDTAGVMLLLIDENEIIQLINSKGCEILEAKEGDIVGKNWFDTFLPAEIREEIKIVHRNLMRGEIEIAESQENTIITSGGKEKTIAWHNTVIRNKTNKIIGTLSSGEDITKRNQMIGEMRKAFEQIDKNIEQFSILVDSIRNPLAVIVALVDLYGEKEKEIIFEHAGSINKIIEHIDQRTLESKEVREFLKKHF